METSLDRLLVHTVRGVYVFTKDSSPGPSVTALILTPQSVGIPRKVGVREVLGRCGSRGLSRGFSGIKDTASELQLT